MEGYHIAGVLLLVTSVGSWLVWCIWSSRQEEKKANREMRRARKLNKEVGQTCDQIETLIRMGTVHDIINAKKCRGCGEQKDVEEFDEIETKEGKSVALCDGCRTMMGLKDPDDVAISFLNEDIKPKDGGE